MSCYWAFLFFLAVLNKNYNPLWQHQYLVCKHWDFLDFFFRFLHCDLLADGLGSLLNYQLLSLQITAIICNCTTVKKDTVILSFQNLENTHFAFLASEKLLTVTYDSGLLLARVPAAGSAWHPRIFADQLNLFKPGGRLCPPHY